MSRAESECVSLYGGPWDIETVEVETGTYDVAKPSPQSLPDGWPRWPSTRLVGNLWRPARRRHIYARDSKHPNRLSHARVIG